MTLADAAQLCALAARHGLALDPATLAINEAGLDFQVGLGVAANGERWVLRVPRRTDMADQIAAEAAVLALVAAELPVAVPRWTICTSELVAYPALPGEPGLTIDPGGALRWRLDLASRRHAEAFGALLARLHAVAVERARAVGVPVEEPAAVRARWRRDVAAVAAAFTVAPELHRRWAAWLDDDSFWPTWSVLTHGELYPAHVLIDADDTITGVLDWTTARVSDPARDFAFQHAMTSPEIFALTVDAYVRGGGRVWPRLADHAAELWAASPVTYGVYALQTGDEGHRAAAQAQLAPPA
ncbi:MAG: phosphotransferase [Kofleriaceae bacterium]|nr:phosphotransferase [Kofleriaceae bacterium]MCL4226122.1 macrolide 2'-phosphotransferase [Myxococcales bacterium]